MLKPAPPPYIAAANVIGQPVTFAWRGVGLHIGPTQGTRLHRRLARLPTCALVGLGAATLEWVAWRMAPLVDPPIVLAYTRAVHAWTVHPYHLIRWRVQVPDDPMEHAVVLSAVDTLSDSVRNLFWTSPAQPTMSICHLLHLARHIQPDPAPFQTWLFAVLQRLEDHARSEPPPAPGAPPASVPTAPPAGDRVPVRDQLQPSDGLASDRGVALPPACFDPDFDYDPDDRAAQVQRFLDGLDPAANRFLRSPAGIEQSPGFTGRAYQHR